VTALRRAVRVLAWVLGGWAVLILLALAAMTGGQHP
jgi:hypothetical protein